MARAALLVLVVAPHVRAEGEVLREEAYNYRIVGTLPAGWKRDEERLAFTYSFEGVPHTYVHFVRERLRGDVNVRDELKRRSSHYRFPGAPKDAPEKIEPVQWGGHDAFVYEHEATLERLPCRRIVRALFHRGTWYECIETHHGEPTPAARAGLACFRGGFRLLAEAMPAAEKDDPAARDYRDGVYGFLFRKPEGFLRIAVSPGEDPGCRLAFERRGPTGDQHLVVRVFEYGVREQYDPAKWLELFFQAFARQHADAKREEWTAPKAKGAKQAHGARFRGRRDGKPVVAIVALWQAPSGRVLGLRFTAHGGAEATHEKAIRALLESFEVTDR